VADLDYLTTHIRREGLTRDLPPGVNDALLWVTNFSTLIRGERDAVIVDTFPTIDQNEQLIAWIREQDVRLTHVYVTHGHGDHSFGVGQLLAAFPGAVAIATQGTLDEVRAQAAPAIHDGFWGTLFPGRIPDVVLPDLLDGDSFTLEGHTLQAVDCGHTDTKSSTAVWVPDLRLIVGGDVVYNATRMYLAESDTASRAEWTRSLHRLQDLDPLFVVAAHKRPDRDDSPVNLAESIQYLADFDAAVGRTDTAEELFAAMLEKHENRLNPGALWGSSTAAKPA